MQRSNNEPWLNAPAEIPVNRKRTVLLIGGALLSLAVFAALAWGLIRAEKGMEAVDELPTPGTIQQPR